MRREFQFRGVGAGVLQVFQALIEQFGFRDGAADGAITGPGDVARDHAEMSDDGNPLAGHSFDDEGAGRAIDGAGAQLEGAESDADGLLRGCQAMGRGSGEKAVRRGGDEAGQAHLGFG